MTRAAWTMSAIAVAAALATACGGGGGKRVVAGPKQTPKLPPANPEALREFDAGMRALRLVGPEANEKAIPRLRAAVELDGSLWEAWHNLGVVYYAEGKDNDAADAFGKAIGVNPAHTPSLLARAEAYRRMGDRGKARSDYETALARDPDDAVVRARLASLLREGNHLDDAMEVLRDALRAAKPSASVFVELGMLYLAQGRDELAELVLRKALEMDDKSPAAHNALALIAIARGKDQQAFELFDHATSLDPAFLDARFNKAAVLLDAGDYQAAVTELDIVVQRAPDDLAARVALGLAYRGLGQLDRAKGTWEAVVKDAPERSVHRADALFDLAVLEMDHNRNEKAAAQALDRYLQGSSGDHPKRQEAETRKKELGL